MPPAEKTPCSAIASESELTVVSGCGCELPEVSLGAGGAPAHPASRDRDNTPLKRSAAALCCVSLAIM